MYRVNFLYFPVHKRSVGLAIDVKFLKQLMIVIRHLRIFLIQHDKWFLQVIQLHKFQQSMKIVRYMVY